MSTIIKENYKVKTAFDFVSSVTRTTPSPDILYAGIGKNTAWSNEASPDTAVDSVATEVALRQATLGIKKVTSADICLVIQRINWTTGTTYDAYTDSTTSLFGSNFYVLTDDYNVYKCISNNGSAPSTVKPTGTLTTTITTADGYQWKFMYDLGPAVATNFLVTDWLPVPTGTQKTAQQLAVEAAATYASGSPIGGHGKNAALELGASTVMVRYTFVGNEMPIDTFRQVFLWSNPLDNSAVALTGDTYVAADYDLLSGTILYSENRTSITRSTSQTETIHLVVDY